MKRRLFIILFGLFVYGAAAAQMYIWVDENGVKNFSNAPPPAASAEGSQLDCQDEITSKEPEPEEFVEDGSLEHQTWIQERYVNLLKQQFDSNRSMELGTPEVTEHSTPLVDDLQKKAAQLAQMADKEKDRVEKEYKDALSECSDRYFPNARQVIECRERTHEQYEKRIELLENDSEAYFNRYGGGRSYRHKKTSSRPFSETNRTAPIRHKITIPVKTTP